MNRVSTSSADKRVMLILVSVMVLSAAVLTLQLRPLASTRVDAEVHEVPASVENSGVIGAEAAPAASLRRGLLEPELKEGWRAQIWMQSYMNAITAPGQPGLEKDLKEVLRANLAERVEAKPDLLERDLKEIWQAQMLTGSNDSAASMPQDRSGLERDLKDVWRANLAGGSGVTP